MSTYKFTLTKRNIVSQHDSSLWAPDEDSTIDSTQLQDIAVSLYLDDVLKHTVTVTDAGATLEFTDSISQGAHTIRIVAAKDPIQHTKVCVDQLLIDDAVAIATQYNYNAVVSATTSTLKQKCVFPNHAPFDYIWWGNTITNDSTLNLEGPFYRPTIVADHQGEWVWDFNITASGVIWFQDRGDINDILYDSTAQHTYYLATVPDSHAEIDEWYTGLVDDSSSATFFSFVGPGTYSIDSASELSRISESLDETAEDSNSIVVYSSTDYNQYRSCYLWYQSNTVTAITAT